jgi:predicted Zn finger-like uncharacterized protein
MVSHSLTDRLLGSTHLAQPLRFAMLIVCPSCTASYAIHPLSLGREGRAVRCTRCRNVWTAATPAETPGADDADDEDLFADREENTPESEVPRAEFATIDGIDMASLSADIAVEDAAREAKEIPGLITIEPAEGERSSEATASHHRNIENLAARRRARRKAARRGRWRKPALAAAIILLVAAHAGLVARRNEVVQRLPQTASLYAAIGLPVNLRGLGFENVRMSRTEQDGVGVLVVEGSIVNVIGRPVEVPRLRLTLRNAAKQEIYSWTAQPGRSVLAPGDAFNFRSRLASPPSDARDVQVRFSSGRDRVAGLN